MNFYKEACTNELRVKLDNNKSKWRLGSFFIDIYYDFWCNLIHNNSWWSIAIEMHFKQNINQLSTKSFRYTYINVKWTLQILKKDTYQLLSYNRMNLYLPQRLNNRLREV